MEQDLARVNKQSAPPNGRVLLHYQHALCTSRHHGDLHLQVQDHAVQPSHKHCAHLERCTAVNHRITCRQ